MAQRSVLQRIARGMMLSLQGVGGPCCATPPPMSGFDADEQAKVERAWSIAESAPNAHLLSAVSSVSKGNGKYGAAAMGSHVTVDQSIGNSDKELAADLIHEAAHCHYKHFASTPSTERVAVIEENTARAAWGLRTKNPDDVSWHRANGFLREDSPPPAQTSAQQGTQPVEAPAKLGWCDAPGPLGLNKMRAI